MGLDCHLAAHLAWGWGLAVRARLPAGVLRDLAMLLPACDSLGPSGNLGAARPGCSTCVQSLCSELVDGGAYEYEFSIESCAGEVEEGLGGKVRGDGVAERAHAGVLSWPLGG